MDEHYLRTERPVFVRTVVGLHGEAGRAWLARLPEIIAGLEARWHIRVGLPYPDLSFNFAAPADGEDGTRAVLKVGVPNPELSAEIAALRHFAGQGAVRLLAADERAGALLLERLEPGTPLRSVADDAQATATATAVMRRLWRPAPDGHPFPTVARWGLGFQRLHERFPSGGPLPAGLVATAERHFAALEASAAPPVVLHGDLHHWNVLRAGQDEWLAIDPKGLVGEPAYETGAWLRNPLPDLLAWPDPEGVTVRRITQFADSLGLERERIRAWGMAQAVLSAWWCVEDGGDCWEDAIRVAELLDTLRV